MDWIKWTIGFIGHLGLWFVLFNRIHATAWPRSTRKFSEKAIFLAILLPIVWIVTLLVWRRSSNFETLDDFPLTYFYVFGCILLGFFFIARWSWRKIALRLPTSVIESRRDWRDLELELETPLLHGSLAKILGRVPFNEVRKLTQQRLTFALDVPRELDGLKICQLSDLHFTGQLGIEYFQRIVELANEFQPDITLVTGDILDDADCLDWIQRSIGNLKADLGVYYVLGNHDRRIADEQRIRKTLASAGLIQASADWHQVEFRGITIRLTGNELPWYRDVESLPSEPAERADLKILLSHSPDQRDWALERSFDLMFAGHTHGGQVALPIIGALVAPSKYGVLYAAGTFQIGKMLMHVSRGISGDEPIRICSPPELGLFTIRSTR